MPRQDDRAGFPRADMSKQRRLVRLIRIGAGPDQVDLQPCGGTHVARTGEIGPIAIAKVEKKGKRNRRIRFSLVD